MAVPKAGIHRFPIRHILEGERQPPASLIRELRSSCDRLRELQHPIEGSFIAPEPPAPHTLDGARKFDGRAPCQEQRQGQGDKPIPGLRKIGVQGSIGFVPDRNLRV